MLCRVHPKAAAGIPFHTLPAVHTGVPCFHRVTVNCSCPARVHACGSRGTAQPAHRGFPGGRSPLRPCARRVFSWLVTETSSDSPGGSEWNTGVSAGPAGARALPSPWEDPRVRRLDPGRPGLRPEDSLRLSPGWTSPDPSCFCGGFLVFVGGELPGFLRKGRGRHMVLKCLPPSPSGDSVGVQASAQPPGSLNRASPRARCCG